MVFSCEFWKIFKNISLLEHLRNAVSEPWIEIWLYVKLQAAANFKFLLWNRDRQKSNLQKKNLELL